jgi:hypothetical protein
MGLELVPLLAALSTLGALIGAGFTTYAEIFFTHAASDGEIDHHERKYLRRLFKGFAFGITLVLFSNIALIVLEYLVPSAPQAVLAAPFWTLQTLTLLIIFVGWLLSKRRIPWWLGSTAVLTAWWMLLFIDLGSFNTSGFLDLLFTYVLVTALVAGVLSYLRMYMRKLEPLAADQSNK